MKTCKLVAPPALFLFALGVIVYLYGDKIFDVFFDTTPTRIYRVLSIFRAKKLPESTATSFKREYVGLGIDGPITIAGYYYDNYSFDTWLDITDGNGKKISIVRSNRELFLLDGAMQTSVHNPREIKQHSVETEDLKHLLSVIANTEETHNSNPIKELAALDLLRVIGDLN